MINKVDPELPNEFLKKWIRMANENPISEEQVEADYPNYSRGLKWQLIEGKIARENELEIANEEIEAHVKQNIAAQYAQYGMDLGDEELTGLARQTLQNREEVRKIYDMLIEDKVISYCKGIVKVKEKDVSFDEFKKMIEKP
jgi:trigger factor